MNTHTKKIAARLLYYFARSRQRPATTLGLSTLSKLLDLDDAEVVSVMPAIVEHMRNACTVTWSNGQLKVYLVDDGDETADTVDRILDYWIHVLGKDPKRTKKSPERQSKVAALLRAGTEEHEIRSAIRGCAASAWHTERGHNDIELICRKRSKVEQFMQKDPKRGAIERGSEALTELVSDDELATAILGSGSPDRGKIVGLLRRASEQTRSHWLRSASDALGIPHDELTREVQDG